ncbi:cysteinyl-tRNA synthetase [Candidatus Caldarchaeum subterraneum]|uniref:Cysteine--tRNA ligase n=1 Tax=Caldiarchaeum subterraneum TaxID=311458 RepID=E6N7M3_CALS0|nr:cysteinyl-tRNA synthetase [Candidatus Caldarchaeum subterraneum]BAJ51076.1 cysteinyl-tRNA synthetase [Candidatus Caldarchaeum subterraneum]
MIKIFNTYSRSLEVFEPHLPGHVTMYVCGPTVYDVAHLGHARTYVAFDAVIRFLEFMGYRVKYARNVTDVGHLRETGEDRMIVGAERLRKHPMEVADKYMMEFFRDMDALGIRRPDIQPRASMHIPEIIEAVEKLVDKGYGYVIDGSVYFDISKFPDYGKLSNIKPEELLMHRIDPDPRKKHPADFALWKESPPSYPFSWKTPWGRGFPGWHIECSIMSMKYLGEQIDIHGGGQELIFPHHENEIAQSEALTGKKPFVKYWMHTGELTVGGRGMHKSYGNFITIQDALKTYPSDVLRLFILSAHYRTPLDYSEKAMEQAAENFDKITNFYENLSLIAEEDRDKPRDPSLDELGDVFKQSFIEAMSEDFNTPNALAIVYDFMKKVNTRLDDIGHEQAAHLRQLFLETCRVLGLLQKIERRSSAAEVMEFVKTLVEVRRELRKRGMYDLADRIRNMLAERGIVVEDTKEGERIRIVR